jgi:NitT/TauT family transport system substrate-binding protein
MTLRWKLFFAAVVFSSGVFVHAQEPGQDIPFFLTFVPNVQFSPAYVAIEKGYFADAGMDVTIEHGDEPLGVDLIAADQLQFGMISGEQLLSARAAGRPVVFVYEWFQRYPIGIVTSDTSDIVIAADLAGRRVGIPGRFGASYSGLTALLNAAGMTEADILLDEIGFNAPEVFCVGAVEASVVYVNNEPLQIADRARAGDCGDVTGVRVLAVADAVDMVSNGIITNERTIAEQPELVTAFVQAFDSGLRDVIRNPAEAYLISGRYVEGLPLDERFQPALERVAAEQSDWLAAHPYATRAELAERRRAMSEALAVEMDGDYPVQYEVLLASIELWDADRLGYTEAESWSLTQEVLLSIDYIAAPLEDLDSAFTNAFLPASLASP